MEIHNSFTAMLLADTNTGFPAFHFHLRQILSQVERPPRSSSERSGTGVEGIGVDELEQSIGE